MSNKIPLTELREYYIPALWTVLDELGEIAQRMNVVEMVTPLNHHIERQKWLENAACGRWTNPHFKYDTRLLKTVADAYLPLKWVVGRAQSLRTQLSNDPVGQVLCEMVEHRIREVNATIDMARGILKEDDTQTETAIQQIFGQPCQAAIDMAHNYVEQLAKDEGYDQEDSAHLADLRGRLQALTFDEKGIRRYFIYMAKRCSMAQSRPVEIDERTTAIDVRDRSSKGPVVSIPTDRRITGLQLVTTIGHEVLCHWRDSERAAAVLPLLGGGALKTADEVLYEGHATQTDYHALLALGDRAPQQQKPFYISAIDLAQQGYNFAAMAPVIFNMVRPTKSTDAAALRSTWLTCYRVLRGSTDINNHHAHYALTKDRAYFEGRILADELHAQHLDSILRLSTLCQPDIDLLRTVVEFKRDDSDQAEIKAHLVALVQELLGEEVVF